MAGSTLGTLILALVLWGGWRWSPFMEVREASGEGRDMPKLAERERPRPLLDQTAPSTFETATFALG